MSNTTTTPPKRERENFPTKLTGYIYAGFPLIWITTHEEARCIEDIKQLVPTLQNKQINLFKWSFMRALDDLRDKEALPGANKLTGDKNLGDPAAFAGLFTNPELTPTNSIFLVCDFHPFFKSDKGVLITRRIREAAAVIKKRHCHIVFISPVQSFPIELERDMTLLNYTLPDRKQLGDLFGVVSGISRIPQPAHTRNAIERFGDLDALTPIAADAAIGLTASVAENVMALALTTAKPHPTKKSTKDEPDPHGFSRIIVAEKANAINKTGFLEYTDQVVGMDAVGGLQGLKTWLLQRREAYTPEAADFGLSIPRGILLLGPPGTGKSLSAKMVAYILRQPLIRFDLGRVFGSLVGQSEAQIRMATDTIDALDNITVWLDEIEKLVGENNGTSDGGVGQRVKAQLLTWMQERTSRAFIVATANDIQGVPPELLRKGRLDEHFFVNVPTKIEREEIIRIKLQERGRNPDDFEIASIIQSSTNYTGAEIEAAIKDALNVAYYEGKRKLTTTDILKSLLTTKPVYEAHADRLRAIVEWANKNARIANTPDTKEEEGGRNITITNDDQ